MTVAVWRVLRGVADDETDWWEEHVDASTGLVVVFEREPDAREYCAIMASLDAGHAWACYEDAQS